ncbi:MAG: Fe-S-cluster-containing hydrogenase component 2/CRP-like cAMP-binding protein [Chlamydiales bacterium]|jgi:Fe-S-cluster-containing hydrogenase component 2/CRP-like cAMP-binding protein
MSGLPSEVFDLPLLADLTKKQRSLLEDEAYMEVAPAGSVFAHQGEFTGRFCIVLEGGVGAYREEDGVTENLGVYGTGTWIGELSALSNQPELATLRADARCVLLVIEPPLFKQLYRKVGKSPSRFQQLVDATYRERSLAIHLRVAPVFKGLPGGMLKLLGRKAELIDFAEGEVIASEGDQAGALFLVRTGAVKCSATSKRGHERIVSYHMANSSFGERCLTEDKSWPGTYTAIAPTALIRIPEKIFQETLATDAPALTRLRATADLMVAGEETGSTDLSDPALSDSALDIVRARRPGSDQLEVMVGRQSVKGGEALVIDLHRCIRCNACVESCVSVHEDRVPRLSKTGTRVSGGLTLATSCYNCDVPECMMACEYGAIRRDVKGQINFVWDNCVGCQGCTTACPYGVISMTPPPTTSGERPRYKRHWFLETIPFLGKYFEGLRPAGEVKPQELEETPLGGLRGDPVKGKAVKCDLCAGLPFEACVYNCPTEAIGRMNPEKLFVGNDR